MAGAKRALVVVSCFILLLSLAPPTPVFANAGPVEWPAGGYGGTLVPVKNGSVAVLRQRLVIDWAAATRYDHGPTFVPIHASYHLRNESDSDQTVLVAFPYWAINWDTETVTSLERAKFRVSLDGAALSYADASIAAPETRTASGDGLLRDLGKRAGGVTFPVTDWQVRAVTFEVALPARGEGILDVAYSQYAAVSKAESHTGDLVQVDYILQTARYWKDFRDLEVEVRAPRGMRLESNLAHFLTTEGDIDTYVFRSPTLPETNLRVAVLWPVSSDKSFFRLIGGGNDYAGQMSFTCVYLPIILVVTLAFIAWFISRALRRKRGRLDQPPDRGLT